MGNCYAKVEGKIDDDYEALGFVESEIKVLKGHFDKMDRENQGLVHVSVILSVAGVEDCVVTRQCFSFYTGFKGLFADGRLTFKVFVFLLWNFCTLTVRSFSYLFFEVYDKESKGALVTEDVVRLLTDLKVQKDKITSALHDCPGIDLFDHGRRSYDLDRWESFCAKYVGFFSSLAERQTKIKSVFGGLAFWDVIESRKFSNNGGIELSICKFVEGYVKKYMTRKLNENERHWPVSTLGVIQDAHAEIVEAMRSAKSKELARVSIVDLPVLQVEVPHKHKRDHHHHHQGSPNHHSGDHSSPSKPPSNPEELHPHQRRSSFDFSHSNYKTKGHGHANGHNNFSRENSNAKEDPPLQTHTHLDVNFQRRTSRENIINAVNLRPLGDNGEAAVHPSTIGKRRPSLDKRPAVAMPVLDDDPMAACAQESNNTSANNNEASMGNVVKRRPSLDNKPGSSTEAATKFGAEILPHRRRPSLDKRPSTTHATHSDLGDDTPSKAQTHASSDLSSDFASAHNEGLPLHQPLADFATHHPITLEASTLASEVKHDKHRRRRSLG